MRDDGWLTEQEVAAQDAPPVRTWVDEVIERDPRGSVWVKGRVCAVAIYLGWTLCMVAAFTNQVETTFTDTCLVVGLWLLGIGITSGFVWFVRKSDG